MFVLYAIRSTLYAIPDPSDERQATCDEFALFCAFYADFCALCASLRLIKHLFRQLLNKAISMALWTKAITCDKAGFKSRFCQVHQAGKIKIGVNRRNPRLNISSCASCASWLKNLFNQRNPRLINDLRLRIITYEIISKICKTKPISEKVK